MSHDFLPFSLPDIGDEEIAEVVDALRSGWITTGPKTKRFESEFSQFIGGNVEAIAVNSATAGLHLALEAVGVGPGDEVIVPSFTFTATAEVVRYLGADPIFVDIDASTFNIDPAVVEAAITTRTKAIIPVHFAGLACDMDRLISIARRHGLKVVEDAAHALPTTWGGRLVGSLDTDATVFSFYATKTITTGEGGMVVTRDAAVADRCRVMRLHGISRDAFERYRSSKPSWYYEVIAPGYKYNMTDVAAAMGIHQLAKANLFHKKRAALAAYYDKMLGPLPLHLPPHAPTGDLHSWHLYVVLLDDSIKMGRDEFIERMANRGIGCSVHFIPLHLQPYWRDSYALQPEDCPNTLRIYERAVSLPLYTKMTDDDAGNVVEAINEIIAHAC